MAHPHADNLCCVHLFLIVLEPIRSKGNRICRARMETRIIPDEDMADAATTKKVAEIFLPVRDVPAVRIDASFGYIYMSQRLNYFECA
ncbi:hypothetical protein PIB30_092666 [Stylosanthes scabra]|uniref:Uncharacterized protein n=1 Tax=Stylosanthes scabra TaxID=79078 RepID=A0ABU6VUS8_9FABA|nr:hypothetical protein [Stylosanthes scabra]